MSDRERLIAGITSVMTARILWVLIPARRALGINRNDRLDEIVGWGSDNVEEDVRCLLAGYEIRKR